MVQNLKVDVIYHRSASDFEMEFNLCGCCRMRMLSDKTNDKKSFIRALARDVARSRVIIVCGPLFGADGLISMVGTAIGNGTAVCDNKTYGISGEDEIKIINGSTPLVTPDGYFGGCIIESGPQTIILLTENKTFRKAIMQNLIHPYLEEISYIPTKNTNMVPAVEGVSAQAVTEDEEYLTETDPEYAEEVIEEVQIPAVSEQEHNIEFIMDTVEEIKEEKATAQESPSEIRMYTEVETAEEIKERYENPYIPSENDDMFIASPEYDGVDSKQPKKQKDSVRSLNIVIVVLVLLLLLAVLALVYFMVVIPVSRGISPGEYIKQIFGKSTAVVPYL